MEKIIFRNYRLGFINIIVMVAIVALLGVAGYITLVKNPLETSIITPLQPQQNASNTPSIVTPSSTPPQTSPELEKIFPKVMSFDVTPNTITSGEIVTASFSVIDSGGSHLKGVSLSRAKYSSVNCNTSSKSGCEWTITKTENVSTTLDTWTGKINDKPTFGSWWYGLKVTDNAGNAGYEAVPIQILVNTKPTSTPKPAVTIKPSPNTISSSGGPVKLISPNGGEQWKIGQTYSIKWTGGSTNDKANFYIFTTNVANGQGAAGGIFFSNLLMGASNNSGNYSWTINKVGNNDLAYTYAGVNLNIKVCVGNSCDQTDAPICVAYPTGQPSMSILYPNTNTGISFKKGEVLNIKWFMSCDYPSTINITLVTDSGSSYKIISNMPRLNNSTYAWTIGSVLEQVSIPDGQYRIQICSASDTNCKKSFAPITITSR